jgi:hypothetical protein
MATMIHDFGMGWHPDLPDIRDYTDQADSVRKVLAKSAPLKKAESGASPAARSTS